MLSAAQPDLQLGASLLFEEELPVLWTAVQLPGDAALARINADNHHLLSAVASLEEVRVPDALKDESAALVHELQRLDYKLNILLRLAAQVSIHQLSLPPASTVRLSATGLEWCGDAGPAMDSTGLLKLYISPALPQPLTFPATVVGEAVHDGVRAARLRFTGLSEPVVDLIEKLIFRHHRRNVACARAPLPRSA